MIDYILQHRGNRIVILTGKIRKLIHHENEAFLLCIMTDCTESLNER